MASLGKMARQVIVLSALLMAAFYLMPFVSSRGATPAPFSRRLEPRAAEFKVPRSRNSSVAFNAGPDWCHQNFAPVPAIPIIELSKSYIIAAINGTSEQPMNATLNSTSGIHKLALRSGHQHGHLHQDTTPAALHPLVKRGAAEPCDAGSPCPDKSCCSKIGKCGYGPDYCGNDNCISNCNATAMCGRYSEGGSLKCGMNLCCSYYGWCGTDDLHCGNPDEHQMTPCQEEFGLCKVIPAPSCDAGAGSANGRTIGYYQASNTRDRICNRVAPSKINTAGLTHLYFAFAKIDPNTFATIPANDGDVERYTEFNKLQSSSLKTWIAIGGFDFSDPGPTRHTWSDLADSEANRAAFISSLKGFMSKHGFQGVDIDWEYPVTPERGGKRADYQNFVSLVKEMKAAFGDQYGLSLTLAPDYWYLRGFDAKAMEPYVDFFGFMAYDLHGFWDADLKTLGAKVRGQTDIREIYNDTLPLWFDNLNPSKINFGLAYYGRGYTLANAGCNQLECPFIGPSLPGPCTKFNGVLSLAEIKQYIRDKGLQPQLLEKSMMKQITWGNQWIGYDDSDTIAMKKKFASGMCFGGTMIWSVDFETGSGINSDDAEENAPKTTDGKCGKGVVCGDWKDGGCCSSSGFCGSGPGYCGNGCQSGPCLEAAETTDGTCGPMHGNSICGSWPGGSCCSVSGYCGDDDAHCGQDCASGPCDSSAKGGVIYIDPEIWGSTNPVVYCNPPCLYVLPPLTLSSTTTISFPPFTTSLEVAWKTSKVTTLSDGQVSTTTGYDRVIQTTVLTIPPVTTNRIDVWNVRIPSDVQSSSVFQVTRSILPPPFTITDDRNPRRHDGETHPVVIRTITPPPFPYPKSVPIPTATHSPGGDSSTSNHPPGGDSSTSGGTITGGPTGSSPSSTIIKFPYPTTSGFLYPPQVDCPDCVDPPAVTHNSGDPKNPCKKGCGHPCDPLVGAAAALPGPLGAIASGIAKAAFCDKPCFINCGTFDFDDPVDINPPPGPPPGSVTDDSVGSDDPDDPNESDPETTTSCSTQEVTNYFVSCTTVTSGSTSSASCKTTSSATSKGCKIKATATTTTASSCPRITDNPDEDEGEDGDLSPPTPTSKSKSSSSSAKPTPKSTTEPKPKPTTKSTTEPKPKPTETPDPPYTGSYREFNVGYYFACPDPDCGLNFNIHIRDTPVHGLVYRPTCYDKTLQSTTKGTLRRDALPWKTRGMDVEFDKDHHATCTYEQTEFDKPGKFECDDGTKVVCKEVDTIALRDPKNPNQCSPEDMNFWRNQAVCSIGDPDSAPPAVRPAREYYPGYYIKCFDDGHGGDTCDYDFQILYRLPEDDPHVNFPCRSKVVWDDFWLKEEGLFPYQTGPFPATFGTDNAPQCDYHQDEPAKAGYFNCFGGLLVDCVDYDHTENCGDRESGDPMWRFVAKCTVSNPD